MAYSTDSRLLEIARYRLLKSAKYVGIKFKQTFVMEGKQLRRKATACVHAKQFRCLRRAFKRQRAFVGIVIWEIQSKLKVLNLENSVALERMNTLLERVQRLVDKRSKDKNKLDDGHAPEVEWIGKDKARQSYEFGVAAGFVVTHKKDLIFGARTFPGNPFDGHALAEQQEQARILIEDHDTSPKPVYVDLGCRGVDHANPCVEIIHRDKYKSMLKADRKKLRRRQAILPSIGHFKADHGMIGT